LTRAQQTWTIVGALGVIAAFFAFVFWPEPNLDGMSRWDKCEYRSFYKNRGGSPEACQAEIAEESRKRLMRGY